MAELMRIVVSCRRPGLIRAGRPNPGVAVYAPGDFTEEQLAELVAEPEITVVVGEVLTLETIPAMFAPANASEPKARK